MFENKIVEFQNHPDQKIIQFLIDNGYEGLNFSPLMSKAKWEIFKKGNSEVKCQCNEKSPQFHIERHEGAIPLSQGDQKYDYYSIRINGETDIQDSNEEGAWIYANLNITKDMLLNKLPEIEARLMKMWEAIAA